MSDSKPVRRVCGTNLYWPLWSAAAVLIPIAVTSALLTWTRNSLRPNHVDYDWHILAVSVFVGLAACAKASTGIPMMFRLTIFVLYVGVGAFLLTVYGFLFVCYALGDCL